MKKFYRKATAEELRFYQERLYPLQDKVFEVVSAYGDKLYLTGGTALSRFYFDHRLSEDLDFFTPTNDLKEIADDLRLRLVDQGFVVEVGKLEIYFARLFIVQENYKLKIEFAKEFNLFDPLLKTDKNIFVNSLQDIGVNKITAFEDRATIKDIIDLYYITQKISWEHLFKISATKRVPVAYENLLTVNVRGISGQALITQTLTVEELTQFVNDLKRKTEAEVKKKERLKTDTLASWIADYLWDFPHESKNINEYSVPVLRDRLARLPLPEKLALKKALTEVQQWKSY